MLEEHQFDHHHTQSAHDRHEDGRAGFGDPDEFLDGFLADLLDRSNERVALPGRCTASKVLSVQQDRSVIDPLDEFMNIGIQTGLFHLPLCESRLAGVRSRALSVYPCLASSIV